MGSQFRLEFESLRKAALVKRDKAIAIIRCEYAATLVQIAELERGLGGCALSASKRVSECVDAIMPQDRPFSLLDLISLLEAADSSRTWSVNAVSAHVTRMRKKGIVVRVKRASMNEPAQYVRKGVEVERGPVGDMTMRETIEQVFTRPMTTAEATVGILEAGWRSTMGKRRLAQYAGQTLRLGYKRSGGKWLPKG